MDCVSPLWLLLALFTVNTPRCDSSSEMKLSNINLDDSAGEIDFPDEPKADNFSSYEYLSRKEFEDKRKNIVLFGLHATRNKTIDRRNVIKVLRLSKIPFDDEEIEDVIVLQKDRRYPNPPFVIRFTSAQLQRAIMYRKHNFRRTLFRIEYDLTKKTINKQKRLLPLRRYLKKINISAYIKLGRIVVNKKALSSHEADKLASQHGIYLAPHVTDELPTTPSNVTKNLLQTTLPNRQRKKTKSTRKRV